MLRATYAGDLVQYDVSIGSETVPVEVSTAGHGALLPAGADVRLSWLISDTLVFEAAP